MPSLVFADIDGTLMETSPGPAMADLCVVGAWDNAGHVIAVRRERHEALITMLGAAHALIPVTGRSVGALGRVNWNFNSYAVAHHGAVVLQPNRERDSEFEESIRSSLDAAQAILDTAYHDTLVLVERSGALLRVSRQLVAGRTVEVCVKSTQVTADGLGPEADVIEECWQASPGIRIHRNGNNLAMLPLTITKERAMEWVVQRIESQIGPCVRFGVGDSLTDLGFMRRCDFFIVPAGSQIDRSSFGDLQ